MATFHARIQNIHLVESLVLQTVNRLSFRIAEGGMCRTSRMRTSFVHIHVAGFFVFCTMIGFSIWWSKTRLSCTSRMGTLLTPNVDLIGCFVLSTMLAYSIFD